MLDVDNRRICIAEKQIFWCRRQFPSFVMMVSSRDNNLGFGWTAEAEIMTEFGPTSLFGRPLME